MISITACLQETFIAKNTQDDQFVFLGKVSVVGILVFLVLALAGELYDQYKSKLSGIDTTLSSINVSIRSQSETLVRIEEKLKYLDHRVELLERPHYESKAKAAGFKTPQIVPASLQVKAGYETRP